MEIHYLGHASFLIEAKTPSGKVRVVIDPFDSKLVGLPWRKQTNIDLLLISHEHGDHNFRQGVEGRPYVIAGPGEYEVKGVKVLGLASFHDEEKGARRGKNTIYLIEAEGIFVCHLGDLGHTLSDEEIESFGRVDILLVPVGGFYTIDAKKSLAVTTELEPIIVIPMHYKASGLAKQFDVLTEVSAFLKEVGQPSTTEKVLKVEKNSLPQEEMKVVVLERSS